MLNRQISVLASLVAHDRGEDSTEVSTIWTHGGVIVLSEPALRKVEDIDCNIEPRPGRPIEIGTIIEPTPEDSNHARLEALARRERMVELVRRMLLSHGTGIATGTRVVEAPL